ncbi:MAG: glycosyltransferase [Methylacidiphilales bacterium]|nr:glycosyltransferase [Candidatus Methylacidiphilales bacterium]NJR18628.1 glycosyltransferase [Calothrix sp. CSU_2_0]
MKILHVVPGIEAATGGPGRIAASLCNSITQMGFEVDIATTKDPLQRYELIDTDAGKSNLLFFERWQHETYAFSRPLKNWLTTNIKNYDVVHIHSVFNYPTYIAAELAIKNKVPYVIAPHGMLEPWAFAYRAWKKRFFYDFAVKKALKNAQAIHATSSPETNNIKSLGVHRNLVFIPNGVKSEEFDSLPSREIFYQQFPQLRDKKLIVFLARIDPKKGLDLLASAFTRVKQLFPNSHLVIIGSTTTSNTQYLDSVKQYFARANCLDNITFTGMLTGEIKLSALAAASIYVSPSYSEGFSVSVLEGMAAGLPCVITTGCNFPEAENAQAVRVVNINADDIANGLIWCLQHPEEAKKLGDRGRKFILDNYTWHRLAEKMGKVYSQLIK